MCLYNVHDAEIIKHRSTSILLSLFLWFLFSISLSRSVNVLKSRTHCTIWHGRLTANPWCRPKEAFRFDYINVLRWQELMLNGSLASDWRIIEKSKDFKNAGKSTKTEAVQTAWSIDHGCDTNSCSNGLSIVHHLPFSSDEWNVSNSKILTPNMFVRQIVKFKSKHDRRSSFDLIPNSTKSPQTAMFAYAWSKKN